MIFKILRNRWTYVGIVIIFIVMFYIWTFYSAKQMSIPVDKQVGNAGQAVFTQAVVRFPKSDQGFVNGYTPTKQDLRIISHIQSDMNSKLDSVWKYPIENFNCTVDTEVLGPSVIQMNTTWSYDVVSFGTKVQYSRNVLEILEHASDGSIVSLDQLGHVIPPSQHTPWPQ